MLRWLSAVLLLLVLTVASADYSPPVTVEKRLQDTPADIAQRVAPAGSDWLLPPRRISFGAYEGVLLAFHDAPGYCIWYLADVPGESRYRVLRLRDPEKGDDFFDLRIESVFTLGPESASDLVMLEAHQQPQLGGGELLRRGSVYRVIAGSAARLAEPSRWLNGVDEVEKAKQALTEVLQPIPEPPEGTLAQHFMKLPVRYLDLTLRERAQLIQPDNPRLRVLDRPNGYLQIAGDAGLPGYTLVMFQRPDATSVFAFQAVYPMTQFTFFLTLEPGGWRDISAEIVPGYSTDLNYQLPRHGTQIEVLKGAGETRYSLEWTGQVFRER